MKLLFLLAVIAFITTAVYLLASYLYPKSKKKKQFYLRPIHAAAIVGVVLLGVLGFGLYSSARQPDMQCGASHSVTLRPPTALTTAMGFFAKGNYDYDRGNCTQAIISYTKAIQLNPTFAQAYNNRGYTHMRLRDYKNALADLNKALQLNPNYVQALMNRADMHNYYYQIDRQSAIIDYKRVIALTDLSTRQQSSVCGHLFLAKHNGWTFGAFIGYFTGEWASCK